MKKRAAVLLASALLLGGLTFTALPAGAVPADPTPFVTEQPDGTEVTVRTLGDEHFHWNEDDEGWLICYSENDRTWYYAALDENKDLVPGPFAVGGEENVAYGPPAEPTAATRLAFEDIADIAQSRAAASIAASAVCLEEIPSAEEANALASESSDASSADASSTAKKKNTSQDLLLLLIEYTDVPLHNGIDFWGERYFGTEGTTVTNYYMDQSGEYDLHFNRIKFKSGNITVTPTDTSVISKIELKDGVAKVTFNRPHPGSTDSAENDVKTAFSYVKDYIDFSGYTGDALYNNYIRQDYFQTAAVIAGWEESAGQYGNHTQKVWARARFIYFNTSSYYDRIQVSVDLRSTPALKSFMMHGELYSGVPTTVSAQTIGVGVAVHEMGHCLGLPDLYDTGSDSSGLSGFSVMASGSWGAKDNEVQGTTPVGLDAWSKIKLGFAEPVEISAKQINVSDELTVSSDQPEILKLTSPEDPNQYFLVENRQLTGYDAGLKRFSVPADGGICIYHIDESVITSGSEINRNRYHYGVELLLADGNNTLRTSRIYSFTNLHPFFVKGEYAQLAPDADATPYFYTRGHSKDLYDSADIQCHDRIIPSWISLEVQSVSSTSMTVLVNPTVEGDVDNDGKLTPADRMLIARYKSGWKISVTINPYAADLDGDTDVDDTDLRILNHHFAGWPDPQN